VSRVRNATVNSAFAYTQYGLALVTGFVLFPLVVWQIGKHDYGLWLVSGELVGYLLLGDLGVFTVLPWLVAAKHGARDYPAIGRYVGDAVAVGVVVGAVLLAAAGAVLMSDPVWLRVQPDHWAKLRVPLAVYLGLTGVAFPLRAFGAVLAGLQDVTFGGLLSVLTVGLTAVLTAVLVLTGFGLLGLAVSAGLPPLLAGLAAAVRYFVTHRPEVGSWKRPTWAGGRYLLGQGFGSWMSGLGVRMLTASTALVFAAVGQPGWATVLVATGKVAQVAQPFCQSLPDSALVGLSQLHGEGERERTRRVVSCLLLMYLIAPGFVGAGLLAANAAFVNRWIGAEVFGGLYVSGLLAAGLVAGNVSSSVFKVVAVAGYRTVVGLTALVGGAVTIGLGYLLSPVRGPAGVVEAYLIVLAVTLPIGVWLLRAVYGFGVREYVRAVGSWAVRATPVWVVAGALGGPLTTAPVWVVAAATAGLCVAYLFAVRPLIVQAPWPDKVRALLSRSRYFRPPAPPQT
jgi:O-antigen/teichoic acid export membrane protein